MIILCELEMSDWAACQSLVRLIDRHKDMHTDGQTDGLNADRRIKRPSMMDRQNDTMKDRQTDTRQKQRETTKPNLHPTCMRMNIMQDYATRVIRVK